MKGRECLLSFLIGAILSFVFVLTPAHPALAVRDIECSPDEGRIGDTIDIDGENWPPSDPSAEPPFYRYIDIYFTSELAVVGDNIDNNIVTYELVKSGILIDTRGNFGVRFNVPPELTDGSPCEDVRGGVYCICVTYENEKRIRSVEQFTVSGGEITNFSPKSGAVGTEVDVSGEYFGAREDITVLYDGDEVDIESGDSETDSRGRFDCTVAIPPSIAGKHIVTIQDETLSEVEEIFTVEPEIKVIPNTASSGNQVKVSGNGFGNRVHVEVFLNGHVVASAKTGHDGSFTVDLVIPDIVEGFYRIEAEDDDRNEANTELTVEIGTRINASPVTSVDSPGYVGQSITISGLGFKPNTEILITNIDTNMTIAATTSDTSGSFIAVFNIPEIAAGAHNITASDGQNSAEATLYMESTAPAIPQLISPQMCTRASTRTQFDWVDVDDDSGVTYDLQIATNDDFSLESILLTKLKITESEYILTKSEALASRSAAEPYYWRIRAVDGASNASDWSMVGEFSVGFTWSSWMVHLWWGLGVAGVAFLFYRLGKRGMYY